MSYTVGSTRVINTTSSSGTTDFTFTFPYIKEAHIEVYLNYQKLSEGTGTQVINGVTYPQYQVITNVSPKLIRLGTGTTSANVRIEIRRNSSLDSPLVDYADGSTLTANDLDTSALQSLYIDQELKDSQFQTVSISATTGLPTLGTNPLTEVANPTNAQDAATKSYVDSNIDTKIDSALTDDIAAGSSISITDNSPSSGKVTLNVIAASGSNSGSLSASDKSKLDGIETSATADQTNAEIRAAVEAASDSNVFTDADHTKLNAIETSATADQTGAEIKTAYEAESNTNAYTDAEKSKLAAIEAGAKDDQTASEIKTLLQSDKLTDSEIATGALDGRYYTETESDDRYFNISTGDTIKDGDTFPDNDTTIATTAAINDRIVDLVDDVGGFVPIANETSFPNANPDVNNGTGTLVSIKALSSNVTSNGSGVATISNGTVGNSTVTITGLANSTTYASTFGMIVETTSTLNTYTFHRLVPKATEVSTVSGSISNVNTVAGAISNVNSVASNATNINTVAGINANVTTVAGISSNVTSVVGNSTNINAVNSNATNINTVAGAITNVNNVGGSIANVNTVATNISSVNDFADRYRVASSDPGSNNDTGDLVFNTTSNELRVYNGSAWQGGVTATGNLLSKSGDQMTGNLTFSGSQTVDGRDVSVDGTKLDGIATNANNYTHPNHSGEVTSSTDGAQTIADNVVDEANLKVSNSPSNGKFLQAQSGNTGGLTWADVPAGVGGDTGLDLNDNVKARWGTGNDLAIYHTGSTSIIEDTTSDLNLRSTNDDVIIQAADDIFLKPQGGELGVIVRNNGPVELYYDNVKKIETTSSGVEITGTATATTFSGSGASLTSLNATNLGSGTVPTARLGSGTASSSNFLRGDNTWQTVTGTTINSNADNRLITGSSTANELNALINITATGANLDFVDNGKARFGNSDDLQIFHDGANYGYVSNDTGALFIRSVNQLYLTDSTSLSGKYLRGNAGAEVKIYHNNNQKFETTSSGVDITGTCQATTFSGSGASLTGISISSDAQNNTLAGTNAGNSFSGTSANNNSLFGYNAGNAITTGDNNTIVGYYAGNAITYGAENTIVGRFAGYSTTTGTYNTFYGNNAGLRVSTGHSNIAVGSQAIGYSSGACTGANNIGIGTDAAYQITNGEKNVAIGYNSGRALTTGKNNSLLGYESGKSITTSEQNTCIGYKAGDTITTGNYNICIGTYSDPSSATASGEIVLGNASYHGKFRVPSCNFVLKTGSTPSSGKVLTADSNGEGYWADGGVAADSNKNVVSFGSTLDLTTSNSYPTHNFFLGVQAGNSFTANGIAGVTGDSNIAIGYRTMYSLHAQSQSNIAIGREAMRNGTSSQLRTSVAVGVNAAYALDRGDTVAIGNMAGRKITTGLGSTAIGAQSLGDSSSAVTGVYNTCVGFKTAKNLTSGASNVFIGQQYTGQATTTGDENVGIGNYTFYSNTTGESNTAVGHYAGFSNTTAGKNTCIGYNATGSSTGENNTCIGAWSGSFLSPSGDLGTNSNIICLGDSSIANLYCNDTSISSSDKRDKTDIADFTHGLKWVEQLKPVTYKWDRRDWYKEKNDDGSWTDKTPDGSKKRARQHIGFLAQDVLAIEQADGYASKKDDMLVVNLNEDDTAYGLKYERLVPVLVNAIKELSAKVAALEAA